jgi:hypothetical protein
MGCPSARNRSHTWLLPRLSQALHNWSQAWRASIVAENTYEVTRHQETPRQAAAHAAFKALTGDERPALPEVAEGRQAAQPDTPAVPLGRSVAGDVPSGGTA